MDLTNKGTSNIDIEYMVKQLKIPNFIGVFMNDNLPKQKLKEISFVMNFQNSDENGTHWVAAILHKNKKYYFDPYGCEIPDSIRKLLGSNIIRSEYQIQNFNTYSCGEFCVILIYLLVVKNMDYTDIILTMVDVCDNYNTENNIRNRVGE
jgi:hypothetical protein